MITIHAKAVQQPHRSPSASLDMRNLHLALFCSGSPMVVPGKRRRLARRAAPIDIDMGTLEDI